MTADKQWAESAEGVLAAWEVECSTKIFFFRDKLIQVIADALAEANRDGYQDAREIFSHDG